MQSDKEVLYLNLKTKYSMDLHVAGKFELDWVLQKLQSSGKKKIQFSNGTTQKANSAPERGDALCPLNFPLHQRTDMTLMGAIPGYSAPFSTEGSDQSKCSYARDVKPHTLV